MEEATRMLKSLSSGSSGSEGEKGKSEDGQEAVVKKLQRQLQTMKQKTLKLSRMNIGNVMGLIDSGATHPLRPIQRSDHNEELDDVNVTLATGGVEKLKMTKTGTMLSEDQSVEPIIPMGTLIQDLGCSLEWEATQLKVRHPRRGQLPVTCDSGCPQLPRRLTLDLIREAEERNEAALKSVRQSDMEKWMRELVTSHPVLRELPEHVKSKLAVKPGSWKDAPVNRRQRKTMQREGAVIHLFSGPDEGFTLSKAIQQGGGRIHGLLEIDKVRDSKHDLTTDSGIYAGLLTVALDGRLEAIVGGPNCRTRSVLRHRPIEGQPEAPRPVRAWGGQEYGLQDLSREERAKVEEDDVLLWRMVFLHMISTYVKEALGSSRSPRFLMEHPASPKEYQPETVSFWDTWEWKKLKEEFDFRETHIKQKDYGGPAVKPTTLGGNLDIDVTVGCGKHDQGLVVKPNSSKDLSRWAPGLMTMIASALLSEVLNCEKEEVQRKLKAVRAQMTMEEHVAHGHVPYRRDCFACQRAQQKENPHRRVSHPRAGVLSLDTSGPLILGKDDGGKGKFMLVGTFTWAVPKESQRFNLDEQRAKELEEGEEGPRIEDEVSKGDQKGSGDPDLLGEDGGRTCQSDRCYRNSSDPRGDGSNPDKRDHEEKDEDFYEPTTPADTEPEQLEEESKEKNLEDEFLHGLRGRDLKAMKAEEEGKEKAEDEDEDFEIKVFRLAAPMHSKKAPEVTQTMMEFILRLKCDGYTVNHVHTDMGREFQGSFKRWLRARGITFTTTPGDSPQSNGRAEVAVQSIKSMVRRTLLHSEASSEMWPWALRHINEVLRYQRIDRPVDFPPFMQKVMTRKRAWKSKDLEAVLEEVTYFPSWENHGHWIMRPGCRPTITRYVMKKVDQEITPQNWMMLEREKEDPLAIRRRIRGKTSVRRLEVEEKVSEEEVTGEEEESKRKKEWRGK